MFLNANRHNGPHKLAKNAKLLCAKPSLPEYSDMLLVADNIHGLSPPVADAMQRLDPAPIQALVRRCEQAGANLIDVNPGYLSRRNEDRMAFLVQAIQDATSMRLVLDSPNPSVLARGLSACRDKPILNALSLEEKKLREILPLAVEQRTDLVILLMDERSFSPPRVEERIALAVELADRCLKAGLELENLIFDPVLPSLTWDDPLLRIAEGVKTVRMLSSGAIFREPVRTIAGLSNLRSGRRSRYPFSVEKSCLGLLAGAGVTFVLADVLQPGFDAAFQELSRMV